MKITVVIPVYNTEKYLESAINSVLNQSTLPHEIIIINDGSTDSSGELLEKFLHFSLIKIVSTDNKGLGEARNAGLDIATGDYIYFFDSDDLLRKNFIQTLLEKIQTYEQPDMILFSGSTFYDENYESDFSPSYKRKISRNYSVGTSAVIDLVRNGSFFSSACLYVSKKELWAKHDLKFKPIIHEDEEVIFHLLALSGKVLVLDEVFFDRRIRSNSIMTTSNAQVSLEGYLSIIHSLLEFRCEHPYLHDLLRNEWESRIWAFNLKAIKCIIKVRAFRHIGFLFYSLVKSVRFKFLMKYLKNKVLVLLKRLYPQNLSDHK